MIQFQWSLEHSRWAARVLAEGRAVDVAASIRLLPLRGGRCALLARPGVTVNGLAAGPLRMLEDRDEIRAPEGTYYFSAGTLPEQPVDLDGGRAAPAQPI